MNFNKYQKLSKQTAFYPKEIKPFLYLTLGLAGESGEVVEKIKHVIRDKKGIFNKKEKKEIANELGDILWYMTQLAAELDYSLEDIAKMNIEKLFSRKKRKKLAGRGDSR